MSDLREATPPNPVTRFGRVGSWVVFLLLGLFMFAVGCRKEGQPSGPSERLASVDRAEKVPDWEFIKVQGYDTKVGAWWSRELDLRIDYDVGFLAGHYADGSREESYLWFRKGQFRGEWYNFGARTGRDGEVYLYLTFSHPTRAENGFDAPVNLFVRDVPEGDVEEVLRHMLERSTKLLP